MKKHPTNAEVFAALDVLTRHAEHDRQETGATLSCFHTGRKTVVVECLGRNDPPETAVLNTWFDSLPPDRYEDIPRPDIRGPRKQQRRTG